MSVEQQETQHWKSAIPHYKNKLKKKKTVRERGILFFPSIYYLFIYLFCKFFFNFWILFYLFFFIQHVLISHPFYTHQCIPVNPNRPIHHSTTTAPRGFPPLASICLFSTSVSQFLPCKPVHLYHFSRFHIYELIYDICFSLSGLLHSLWQSLDFWGFQYLQKDLVIAGNQIGLDLFTTGAQALTFLCLKPSLSCFMTQRGLNGAFQPGTH